jgi:hypothetical protein
MSKSLPPGWAGPGLKQASISSGVILEIVGDGFATGVRLSNASSVEP